jgi:signal transduction histidine kinase
VLGGRGWLLFLGWMAALTAAYATAHVVGPHWLNSGAVFNLVGLSAVAAILVGARSNPPGRRLPWYLFALGQAFFVLGDVLAYNYERFFGRPLPFPSIADAFYLGCYVPLVAGLLLLLQARRGRRDPGSLIDSLIITIAAAAVSWTFLMAPYAHDATLSLPTKLTSIAYPLMDILVLGVLVRLLVGTGRRSVGFALLTLGFTAVLVTDSIYGWKLLHGGYQTGALLDIGWAGFYALLGASTLHPSTRALSIDTDAPVARLTRKRIGLLAFASLATPLLMVADGHLGGSSDVVVLVASVILFALVLLRMSGLLHRHDEAVHLQAERTAELAAAERSAKAKDAFVSQVSHELRTPLTSILGYLALLSEEGADEPSPAERNNYLTVVDRNADRLLRLVEDLLFVARIDDGKIALDKTLLDLDELTAEAVEAAGPLATQRRIKLRVRGVTGIGLPGDRGRLAQVIDNLLSNALKFTPVGGNVTIDTARSNGSVRLVVTDTGIGMRADELGHLFERFYRSETATAQAIQGSGLGLSITRAIVEAHGGTITASSELGAGTTLTVELPAAHR